MLTIPYIYICTYTYKDIDIDIDIDICTYLTMAYGAGYMYPESSESSWECPLTNSCFADFPIAFDNARVRITAIQHAYVVSTL